MVLSGFFSSCERNDSQAPRRVRRAPSRWRAPSRPRRDRRAGASAPRRQRRAARCPRRSRRARARRAARCSTAVDAGCNRSTNAKATSSTLSKCDLGDAALLAGADPQLAHERLEHRVVGDSAAALLQLALDVPKESRVHASSRSDPNEKRLQNLWKRKASAERNKRRAFDASIARREKPMPLRSLRHRQVRTVTSTQRAASPIVTRAVEGERAELVAERAEPLRAPRRARRGAPAATSCQRSSTAASPAPLKMSSTTTTSRSRRSVTCRR